MKSAPRVLTILVTALLSAGVAQSQTLISWDVNGVNLGTLTGPDYTLAGTAATNIRGGSLTLSTSVNPSTTTDQYGFKITDGGEQTTLSGALSSGHYIQFTLTAATGYQFSLSSINMNGESSGTGANNVAVFVDADGFLETDKLAEVSGVQDVTGGFDTDASGFGSSIALTGLQYQNITSAIFRIYGWNTTGGTGVTYLRDLSGSDLSINGTTSVVPEPSSFAALIGLGALGMVATRRRRQKPAGALSA